MFTVNALLNKINNVINDESTFGRIIINPLGLALIVTIIILVIEFIYVSSKVELKPSYDRLGIGVRLALMIFGASFVIMCAYLSVSNAARRHAAKAIDAKSVINASMLTSNGANASVNPMLSGIQGAHEATLPPTSSWSFQPKNDDYLVL
jgi:hypothetical protein